MKVLMITSSYPTATTNLGQFIQSIAENLPCSVGVLVASNRDCVTTERNVTVYEYTYAKKPLLHCEGGLISSVKSNPMAWLQLPSYFLKTRKHLKRLAKEYDIVHAHWFIPSGLIAVLSGIKKPIIATAWGAEFYLPIGFLLRFIARRSVTTTVSDYMQQRARRYRLSPRVISNSVDTSKFYPKKSNVVEVGTARRLVREKRVDELILACPSNVKLKICGDGPERDYLESLSKKNVEFLGDVPHDGIVSFLRSLQIYVNPSIQEGLATADLEALASGCCVVGRKGVCIVEDRKSGMLYSLEGGLRNVLVELLNDQTLRQRLSKQGRLLALEYDVKKITEKYMTLYKEVLDA